MALSPLINNNKAPSAPDPAALKSHQHMAFHSAVLLLFRHGAHQHARQFKPAGSNVQNSTSRCKRSGLHCCSGPAADPPCPLSCPTRLGVRQRISDSARWLSGAPRSSSAQSRRRRRRGPDASCSGCTRSLRLPTPPSRPRGSLQRRTSSSNCQTPASRKNC